MSKADGRPDGLSQLAGLARVRTPAAKRAGVLFGVALLVRLAYWVVVTPRWVPASDADQYVELARALGRGRGFALRFPSVRVHPTAFRPPLYPALLAPVTAVAGSALWPLRLATVVIGSLAAPLGARLAQAVRPHDAVPVAAWTAGLAIAASPQLVANDTVTLSDGLGVVLLLVALVALVERRPVVAGAALGALLLTRPNGYLAVVIVVVALARLVGWRRAGVAAGIAALIAGSWVVRNGVVVGSWRLTTSDGFNLAAIYSEPAQEARRFTDPVFDPRFDDPEVRFTQLDEAVWQDTLFRLGWRGLTGNPGYVVDVVADNLGAYTELRPSRNRLAEIADGRHWGFRTWAGLPWFYVTTVLGGWGWWVHRRRRLTWVVAALVAQFTVVSAVLIAAPRLRSPVDALMCVGTGLAAAWWARTGPGRRAGRLGSLWASWTGSSGPARAARSRRSPISCRTSPRSNRRWRPSTTTA